MAAFALLACRERGIREISPLELEALVQVAGIDDPEGDFEGGKTPLRAREAAWKTMLKVRGGSPRQLNSEFEERGR